MAQGKIKCVIKGGEKRIQIKGEKMGQGQEASNDRSC